MLKRFVLAPVVAAVILSGQAWAEDLAVIFVNRTYDDNANARDISDLRPLADHLEEQGFDIVAVSNRRSSDLQGTMRQLGGRMDKADRLVVVMAGHIVSTSRDSWLLGRDAGTPDAFRVGRDGLPLGPVLDMLAEKPGAAIVALATSERRVRTGAGVEVGYLPGEVPQGVTVLTGPADDLAAFLVSGATQPGLPLGQALEDAPETVAVYGFVPSTVSFLPPPVVEAAETGPSAAEEAAWARAQADGDVEGYETYLSRYPGGAYADEAEGRLETLRQSPEALAEAEEAGLSLTRDQRREIQRNLSILGYDTRGVDGIFGRGSRAAITGWQRENDFDASGYLTGNQVTQLQIQAERRQRELEEEAKRRQEEQDRLDAEYWRETGRGDTEAGTRAYLERFPDGLFADVARERLEVYEADRREAAEAAERDYWEDVQAADTPAAYRNYLENYPDGAFAEDARGRLGEIAEGEREQSGLAEAEAEEARVLANPITRLLVERRLAQLGLDPGNADGRFDEDTRRAIRRYQRSRDLEVTGYVTQRTLVRMLAGGG
jgi:peptidoglycan hydrolase-like protein with peptidoglycan-binding domain